MPGYGYRFHPDDDQLLNFLHCKAYGQPLPSDGEIKEIDLYSLIDPGKLFRNIQEKKVYVFTKLKKASKNGIRVDRRVTGNRTWKGVDKGKPIFDQEGLLFGGRKNFILINKINMKMGYNMKEYALDERILKNAIFKDYVLCEIKRKITKERTTRIRSSKIDSIAEDSLVANSIPNSLQFPPDQLCYDQNSPVLTKGNSPVSDRLYSQNSSVMDVAHFSPSISSGNSQSASEQTNMVSDGLNPSIHSHQSAEQYSLSMDDHMDLGFLKEAFVFQNQGCLMSDSMIFEFPQSLEEFQNQGFLCYDKNSLVSDQFCSVNSSVNQDNPSSPSISVEFCSPNAQETDVNS